MFLYRLNIDESEEGTKYPVMIGCYSKIPTRRRTRVAKTNGPNVEVYAGGVKNLLLLEKDKLIVGTGDGTVELIEISKDARLNVNKMNKSLTIPAIITVCMISHRYMHYIFLCTWIFKLHQFQYLYYIYI